MLHRYPSTTAINQATTTTGRPDASTGHPRDPALAGHSVVGWVRLRLGYIPVEALTGRSAAPMLARISIWKGVFHVTVTLAARSVLATGGDSRSRFFAAAPATGVDLSVDIGRLRLRNPVMPASGCFGPELARLAPVHELGALVTKTVFAERRSGNPPHRLGESPAGMLNSVGIPSPGTRGFCELVWPHYAQVGAPVVVSIGGLRVREYWTVVEELDGCPYSALEVNVSCPNLEAGGLEIGTDPALIAQVVRGVVERTTAPVFVKLTPSVTSIAECAQAAEQAGASAVTVANTFPAMTVDVQRRRPTLGNGAGGLSGPAIKPMALRLVWQAAQAVDIPVIGCGGITSARDAAEFLLAGASAVQVGTATFTRPFATVQIARDLAGVVSDLGSTRARELIGALSWPGQPSL